jgi:hypothetical protein
MILQDVIDFAAGSFDCVMGYPGRYADGSKEKPRTGSREYVTLRHSAPTYDAAFGWYQGNNGEHELSCKMIATLEMARRSVGKISYKPKLYWRHVDKVEMYKDAWRVAHIRTRLYIDGVRSYGVAQIKEGPRAYMQLVVDNAPNVALLTLQDYEQHTGETA